MRSPGRRRSLPDGRHGHGMTIQTIAECPEFARDPPDLLEDFPAGALVFMVLGPVQRLFGSLEVEFHLFEQADFLHVTSWIANERAASQYSAAEIILARSY
jgi:hypothetical protein